MKQFQLVYAAKFRLANIVDELGFMFVCFFFSFTILFLDALYSSLIFRELHFAHFKTYGNNNSTFS